MLQAQGERNQGNTRKFQRDAAIRVLLQVSQFLAVSPGFAERRQQALAHL